MDATRFVQMCVAIVMTAIVCVVSGFINVIVDEAAQYSNRHIVAWLISSIGFGICLTVILYQNGIF